jgi:hypothetical protein
MLELIAFSNDSPRKTHSDSMQRAFNEFTQTSGRKKKQEWQRDNEAMSHNAQVCVDV